MTKVEFEEIKKGLYKYDGYDVFLYHSVFPEINDEVFHTLRLNFIKAQNVLEDYLIDQSKILGIPLHEEPI